MAYRLKFGILLTSIWASSHMKQRAICETLFHPFNHSYQVDDNCANRSKGCLRNIPSEVVENANKVTKSVIIRELSSNITGLIMYPKGLIEYLLEWLKKDNSINGDTKIGFQNSATKDEYLRKTVFDLNEVITDFLVFTLIRNENQDTEMHKFISTLKKSALSRKMRNLQDKSQFKLVNNTEDNVRELTTTIESRNFDDVFTEAAKGSIDVSNPNNIRAYLLNTNIYRFNYSNLTELVMENICSYVYSRQEMRNAEQDKLAIRKSVLRASQKLRNQANDDQLGQILIYVFLEKVLRAPKLMSKIEMRDNHINGDGLFLNSISPDRYQIVIGSSKLFDDAVIAIDEIIKKLNVMIQNGDLTASDLLLDINFRSHFSTNELQNLNNILKPKKGQHLRTNAFGLFIGYTLNVDKAYLNSLNEEKAEKYIKKCIQKDLEMVIEHLNGKISEYKLQRYSFYVYMMPFTSVKFDSDQIMYEVRGGAR